MTGSPPFRFRYDARLASEIELRWQDRWEREGTFHAANPAGDLSAGFGAESGRPKFYLLDFFPYPSGIGLHVGHPLGYIGTDVFGRYLRMTGQHVLHPFGFDTFGLPAEQYAIDTSAPSAPSATEQLDATTARLLHRTIAVVREDFAALRFHTAIARIIELTAHASRLPRVPRALAEPLVLMVAPLAPHIAEELWQRLGHASSLAREPFPQADPALAATATVTVPVQVNGKVRFTIDVPASADRDDIADLLAAHPAYPRDKVARLVIVPGKIANIVLR